MDKLNISFAGCGFLGIYHVGVASCFKEYAPHLLLNKISGASIGALAGCCLLCDIPLGTFTSELLRIVYEIRKRALGPFSPLVNIQQMLRETLQNIIPENAYLIADGRLFVSMTKITDGQNYMISHYESNNHLIDALLASAFVPLFSGFVPPKVGAARYIDGGFSNNLPVLDENTITVSPFCGESDICPRDSSLQLFHVNLCNTSIEVSRPNIYRFARILFPPSPEVLSMMCKQGFDDALKFLQRNHLINCTKCLTVQVTLPTENSEGLTNEEQEEVEDEEDEEHHDTFDPECKECRLHREKAALSDLPDSMLTMFEDAVQRANKGLLNWAFKHKGMRVVSIMSIPLILYVDTTLAIIKKMVEITPIVLERMNKIGRQFLQMAIELIERIETTEISVIIKSFLDNLISIYMNDKKNITFSDLIDGPIQTNRRKSSITQYSLDPSTKLKVGELSGIDETNNTNLPFESGDHEDTFEHVLNVIQEHESVMAFYYMDDDNKVKLMEFFDVSNEDDVEMKSVEDEEEVQDEGKFKAPFMDDETNEPTEENIYESWTCGNDVNLATSYITPSRQGSSDETDDNMLLISSDTENEWKDVIVLGQPETKLKKNSSFRSSNPSVLIN